MAALDTNMLVRWLTNDDAKQCAVVALRHGVDLRTQIAAGGQWQIAGQGLEQSQCTRSLQVHGFL